MNDTVSLAGIGGVSALEHSQGGLDPGKYHGLNGY